MLFPHLKVRAILQSCPSARLVDISVTLFSVLTAEYMKKMNDLIFGIWKRSKSLQICKWREHKQTPKNQNQDRMNKNTNVLPFL